MLGARYGTEMTPHGVRYRYKPPILRRLASTPSRRIWSYALAAAGSTRVVDRLAYASSQCPFGSLRGRSYATS